MRPSSTARCAGCCGRRASSACSTPPGRRSDRRSPDATSTTPKPLRGTVDLDPPANRALAREIAEHSVVLLRNDGVLPLAAPQRIAVLGPNADDAYAVLGCYSFPRMSACTIPTCRSASRLPTLLDALRRRVRRRRPRPCAGHEHRRRRARRDRRRGRGRRGADVVVLALGDRAGLFGRGTSGEGCDVDSLELPGAQQPLLDALLATGTPTVVLALLSGRPYALGAAATDASAIVQTFFPGEEGTARDRRRAERPGEPERPAAGERPRAPRAPSRRPTSPPPLGSASSVSNVDPTPPSGSGTGSATDRSRGAARRHPRTARTARVDPHPHRAQHRRPSRSRRRAALPA